MIALYNHFRSISSINSHLLIIFFAFSWKINHNRSFLSNCPSEDPHAGPARVSLLAKSRVLRAYPFCRNHGCCAGRKKGQARRAPAPSVCGPHKRKASLCGAADAAPVFQEPARYYLHTFPQFPTQPPRAPPAPRSLSRRRAPAGSEVPPPQSWRLFSWSRNEDSCIRRYRTRPRRSD